MNTTTEIVARDAFIDALDDRQLSLRVREKEPTTLEELYASLFGSKPTPAWPTKIVSTTADANDHVRYEELP